MWNILRNISTLAQEQPASKKVILAHKHRSRVKVEKNATIFFCVCDVCCEIYRADVLVDKYHCRVKVQKISTKILFSILSQERLFFFFFKIGGDLFWKKAYKIVVVLVLVPRCLCARVNSTNETKIKSQKKMKSKIARKQKAKIILIAIVLETLAQKQRLK